MIVWRADVQARFEGFELDVSLQGDARPLAVVGPNGSGKTTLLRAIAGAVPVTHAHVEIGKTVLESTEPGIHVPIELRRVGYVPQGYGLFPHLTVLENVEFGLSTGPDRPPAETRRTRALEMLIELDCKPLANRRVDRLSGGEQQRIALARALVLEPDSAAARRTTRRAGRHPSTSSSSLPRGTPPDLRSSLDHRDARCARRGGSEREHRRAREGSRSPAGFTRIPAAGTRERLHCRVCRRRLRVTFGAADPAPLVVLAFCREGHACTHLGT